MSRLFDLDSAAALAGAAIGHFAIAVWLFNRLHAVALPRPAIKFLEKLLLVVAASVLGLFLFRSVVLNQPLFVAPSDSRGFGQLILSGYVAACWLAALMIIPLWLVPKLRERTPACLTSNDTTVVDVAQRLGYRPVHGAEAQFFAGLPGNELLKISVQRKALRLPGLPQELSGLTIAHLSDLHMTGEIGREFYDVVVDETNALNADLVVITGDILEKEKCLSWIAPTLGRLQARQGKYFILGNHETRLKDVAPLRQALRETGLVDLGGKTDVLVVDGVSILLAGTELPWFGSAPEIERGTRNAECFRLLLSHTPDQFSWARSHGFDLMLAGHNHGGQIRLPYLGALITPSRYGFRYAGGLYFEPPTLLHVSRGLGGIHPIRLNCPPELALLVLESA
jgi:uncharacterized protein